MEQNPAISKITPLNIAPVISCKEPTEEMKLK